LKAPSQAEIRLHLVKEQKLKGSLLWLSTESIWKIHSQHLGGLIKKDDTDFVTLLWWQGQASFGLATVIQAFRHVRSNIYRRPSAEIVNKDPELQL